MTDQKHKEFEELALPLMKWLNDNYHPHVTVIVTSASAELMEGVTSVVSSSSEKGK